MQEDECQRKQTGRALEEIHPVAIVAVRDKIRRASVNDNEPQYRMEQDREADHCDFEYRRYPNSLEGFDERIEAFGPLKCE